MKRFLTVLIALLCVTAVFAAEAFADNALDYSVSGGVVDLGGIRHDDVQTAVKELSKLNGVKELVLGIEDETDLTWDDVKALSNAVPDAVIDYEFQYCNARFNLNCETFDLSYIEIDDGGAEVRRLIPLMKKVTLVNMDSCGIDNETMAKLNSDFPDVEIIWRVSFGERYGVLTNTEMILASCSDLAGDITEATDDGLYYCTKVKYLDLGHNVKMRDIGFVRSMPDLEVAILAINTVQDFSPLADCPKLEYLELFNTGLSDLTPLSGLKNLRHLNICYNFGIRDISPLYALTELERLWIGGYDPVPPEQIAKMREIAPNCEIDAEVLDPTDGTWRVTGNDELGYFYYAPRYALLREQFDGYTEESYSIDPKYAFGW